MKVVLRLVTSMSLLAIFLLAAVLIPLGNVSAHEGEDHDSSMVTQAQSDEEAAAPTTSSYQYVAQPGDSYSLMARKAVQTYGITENITLSQAQIIAAETNLTQQAGSPLLNQGQKVEIKTDNVATVVDQAQKLTDTQKAAWNHYAQHANFNTNNVGQAN